MVYSEGIPLSANATLREIAGKLDILYVRIYELQSKIDALTPSFPNTNAIEANMQTYIDHFNDVVDSVDQVSPTSYYNVIEGVRPVCETMSTADDGISFYLDLSITLRLEKDLKFSKGFQSTAVSTYYPDQVKAFLSDLYSDTGITSRNYTSLTYSTRLDKLTEKTTNLSVVGGELISSEDFYMDEHVLFTILPGTTFTIGIDFDTVGNIFNANDVGLYNSLLRNSKIQEMLSFDWTNLTSNGTEVLFAGQLRCTELFVKSDAVTPTLYFEGSITTTAQTEPYLPEPIQSKLTALEFLYQGFTSSVGGSFTFPSVEVSTITLTDAPKNVTCNQLWINESGIATQSIPYLTPYTGHPVTAKVSLENGNLIKFALSLTVLGRLVVDRIIFDDASVQTDSFTSNNIEYYQRNASGISMVNGKTHINQPLILRHNATRRQNVQLDPSLGPIVGDKKQRWGFNSNTFLYYYHIFYKLEFETDPLATRQRIGQFYTKSHYSTNLTWENTGYFIPKGRYLLQGFVKVTWIPTGDPLPTTDDTTLYDSVERAAVQFMDTSDTTTMSTPPTIVFTQYIDDTGPSKTSKIVTVPVNCIPITIANLHAFPLKFSLYTGNRALENTSTETKSTVECHLCLKRII